MITPDWTLNTQVKEEKNMYGGVLNTLEIFRITDFPKYSETICYLIMYQILYRLPKNWTIADTTFLVSLKQDTSSTKNTNHHPFY